MERLERPERYYLCRVCQVAGFALACWNCDATKVGWGCKPEFYGFRWEPGPSNQEALTL